ncbi:hypothetical protein [Yoonia sp. SDW83-1]|uniref:hypothetical protein n=1 Tax=Yoonia sp. SDW83-1 TaxID=3366945 RepID=UPI00398C5DF3
MESTDREKVAEAFAELTAMLEDATVLAVDGQSNDRSPNSIRTNIGRLRSLLSASTDQLAGIENLVGDYDGV